MHPRSHASNPVGFVTGLAAIVIALALLAWPAIAHTPFFTKGEPREALVVQALVRGEGLLLPLRNGDEIPSKPPLFHWLGALSSLVLDRALHAGGDISGMPGAPRSQDVSEAAVRAPSLLAALIALIATALAAYRWFGAATAVLSAIVLATSVQWLASAVSARVDMVLAATVTLALLLFAGAYERGAAVPRLAYAMLAAGALAKGPVGMVLPVAIVLVFLGLRRDLAFLGLGDLRRLGIAVAVVALWYVAAFAIAGDAFVAKQILKENFYRVIDPDSVEAGHVRPFWYYVPLLLAGFAPWSLFLPALTASLWPRRDRWQEVPLLLPAVWVLVTMALFSLAGSKRGVYLLPAYPALALLAGQAWSALPWHDRPAGAHGIEPEPASNLATATSSRWFAVALRSGIVLVAFVMAVVLALVAAFFAGLPVIGALDVVLGNVDMQNVPAVLATFDEHRWRLLVWFAASAACVTLLLRSMRREQWSRALALVAASVVALAALTSSSVLPAMASRRTPEPFLRRVAEVVPAGASLSFYGGFDYAAVFYRGTPIPFRARLSDVPEPEGVWLLTWRASLPALREEAQKIETGGQATAGYGVDEVLYDADAERAARPSLVLTRIVRRTGDERSDGK